MSNSIPDRNLFETLLRTEDFPDTITFEHPMPPQEHGTHKIVNAIHDGPVVVVSQIVYSYFSKMITKIYCLNDTRVISVTCACVLKHNTSWIQASSKTLCGHFCFVNDAVILKFFKL